MNRIEEYNNVMSEPENTPSALENTVSSAKARMRRGRRRCLLVTVPVSSLAVFFATFVIMVNVSITFAMACTRIPFLRELAAAVTFSPSLTAAVENDYVQTIGQELTENGITMRVEYIIVDQKQVNIFYTLDSEIHEDINEEPSIKGTDGRPLEGYYLGLSHFDEKNGELRKITIEFSDVDVPDSLILTTKVWDNESYATSAPAEPADSSTWPIEYTEPNYISTFVFTLTFEPAFTEQGEVIELNKSFVLDGQTFTVTTIEVYPTHMRLNLADDKSNTAWLESLDFYLEDEKRQKYEPPRNGISASGSQDSPMMESYRIESSFFSDSEKLTLYITGAVWLDKGMERVKVDLKNGTADTLPEGVEFKEAVRKGDDWRLIFSARNREESRLYQLFNIEYFDEAGNDYTFNSWSSQADEAEAFSVQFVLADYKDDIVYLSRAFSRTVKIDTPIVIEVK